MQQSLKAYQIQCFIRKKQHSIIFVFFFVLSLFLSFFHSFFLGGGGRGGNGAVIPFNLGYKGVPPLKNTFLGGGSSNNTGATRRVPPAPHPLLKMNGP